MAEDPRVWEGASITILVPENQQHANTQCQTCLTDTALYWLWSPDDVRHQVHWLETRW